MFCFHKWEIEKIVFTPPVDGRVKNCSLELIEKLAFGFSSIYLRCVRCGKIKSTLEVGDARELKECKS